MSEESCSNDDLKTLINTVLENVEDISSKLDTLTHQITNEDWQDIDSSTASELTEDGRTNRQRSKLRGKMPKGQFDKIQNNYTFITEEIKNPIDLCNKLLEKDVFDMEDQKELMKVFKEGRKNAAMELLNRLRECNGCYDRFIFCLKELGYDKIIRRLESGSREIESERDLEAEREREEKMKAKIEAIIEQAKVSIESAKGKQRGKMPITDLLKIRKNFTYLIENISESAKLSNKLYELLVFDDRDKRQVQNVETAGKISTTEQLLDILCNSGDCYKQFLASLDELGYQQVIRQLESGDSMEFIGESKKSANEKDRETSERVEKEKKIVKEILESTTEEECLDFIKKLPNKEFDCWYLFDYDHSSDTCLMKIIKQGWRQVFTYLVERVDDVHCFNEKQENLLHVVLKCNEAIHSETRSVPNEETAETMLENVKLLVKKGLNIHYKDSEGNTPVLLAARGGLDVVVTYLLGCGASAHDVNNDNQNLLHCLFKSSNINLKKLVIVLMIAQCHKDLDKEDIHRKTPLHFLCDFMKKQTDDDSALKYEVVSDEDEYYYRHQAVCILLETGWNVNKQDENGMTPLMWIVSTAAENDTALQIVTSLLEHGANVAITKKGGKTALMIAEECKKNKIHDLLERHSA